MNNLSENSVKTFTINGEPLTNIAQLKQVLANLTGQHTASCEQTEYVADQNAARRRLLVKSGTMPDWVQNLSSGSAKSQTVLTTLTPTTPMRNVLPAPQTTSRSKSSISQTELR